MANILGISAFYHDSAAALIKDGEIIAAAQEERFSRKKHDSSYPEFAIQYVMQEASIELEDIDHIVFYEKPFLKFERLLETYLAFSPKGLKQFAMSMPIWLGEKLFLRDKLTKYFTDIDENFDKEKLLFSEHHLSHAASAFYPSPFDEALILTMDGVGEWATSTIAIGKGNKIDILKEIHFPHSLGLLYSAFTFYLGFKVNSGEYKVMGLAPYGKPKFKQKIIDNLLDIKPDGSFRMNQTYFNYSTGLAMTNQKFSKLFGQPVRQPESELTEFHMNIAASIQAVIEEIILQITRSISKEYNIDNLCLAGGVALNCVANGKILRDKAFKEIWIQPAAGDAGGALGAALTVWYEELGNVRKTNNQDSMSGSYLGPEYDQASIGIYLENCDANYNLLTEDNIIKRTVEDLIEGKAVGWFQGRMEFGPRALGNRSILGDPRSEEMQKILNLKVKYRESFRPFAPSIPSDDLRNWFKLKKSSPYMLLVDYLQEDKIIEMTESEKNLFGIDKLNIKRSKIPAVTHVDYSARIQTVHAETNSLYYKLLKKFKEETGCPVLINTSFNVRGEPIVCSPEDAFKCFMGTEMETLVIGNYFLRKEDQNKILEVDYKDKYEKD